MLSALAALGAVGILALFVAINAAYVVNRGVCCADDASFAVVAKNLAWGQGYSLTLDYFGPDFSLRRFYPVVGTGPALVLPVSLGVRLFGNRFWVPGAVHVVIWSLLLVAIWRSLCRVVGPVRADICSAVFLGTVYAVSPLHFEQWYAMLGEVPAALCALLAIAVWAADPDAPRRRFLAGILLSMAILLKLLALIYALVFVVGVVAVGLTDRRRSLGNLGRLVVWAILGLALPVLAFESWKLVSLGPQGYVENVQSLRLFISSQRAGGPALSGTALTDRLLTFHSRFGVSLTSLLVAALLGGCLSLRSGSRAYRRLFILLLAAAVAHAAYWLVSSVAWVRYFYSGLVLLCALVAVPFAAMQGSVKHAAYSSALVLALMGTLGRVYAPVSGLGGRWFAAGESRISQQRVLAFLEAQAHRRPFVAQWWAPVADLEYLSGHVLNFKGYQALTPVETASGFLLVTNKQFDVPADRAFVSLTARCGPPVIAASPHAVHECGRGVVSAPTEALASSLRDR